jgi:hypothetical protein
MSSHLGRYHQGLQHEDFRLVNRAQDIHIVSRYAMITFQGTLRQIKKASFHEQTPFPDVSLVDAAELDIRPRHLPFHIIP